MNVPQENKHRVLLIELTGLSITGLLLFVIASGLQLLLRLLSGGALYAERGVLAFGFLFYVCAAFVATGTRQQPDQPRALLSNVGVRVAFLCVGWLLWRDRVSASWLGLALSLVLLVHGGGYVLALLRRGALNALLRERSAIEDAFIERFLLARAPTYQAIPIGGAVGTLLGASFGHEPADIVCDALAGIGAALAALALSALSSGVAALAGSLTTTHDEGRVVLRAVGVGEQRPLRVFVPAVATAAHVRQVRTLTSALRRVLLVNQLQHAASCTIALVVFWWLELPALPASAVCGALLALLGALVFAPYARGARRA